MTDTIRCVNDLKVYRLSYQLAMDIFEMTNRFPKAETYSLTDQIRRSSRSVAINIREGYAKRRYKQVFIRHLNDALGSGDETRGWLSFSMDCAYIDRNQYQQMDNRYDQVNAMLFSLMNNWEDRTEGSNKKSDF